MGPAIPRTAQQQRISLGELSDRTGSKASKAALKVNAGTRSLSSTHRTTPTQPSTAFHREVTLSDDADADRLEATEAGGILELRAPRLALVRPRTLIVRQV